MHKWLIPPPMNNYELKNMKYKVKLLESLNLDATSIFGTRVHNTVISLAKLLESLNRARVVISRWIKARAYGPRFNSLWYNYSYDHKLHSHLHIIMSLYKSIALSDNRASINMLTCIFVLFMTSTKFLEIPSVTKNPSVMWRMEDLKPQ